MLRKLRVGMLLAWAAIFTFVGCNGIWGIEEGHLALERDSGAGEAGARNEATGGDLGHVSEAGETGAPGSAGADSGDSSGGMSMSTGGAATSGGGSTSAGGSSSAGGSTSAAGGAPPCACKAGDVQTGTQVCGRCGTGSQSRTRTCGSSCTWGAWSAWDTCSQCDTQNWRCCAAGKWEFCYDSDCAWTQNCASCVASSCGC